MRIPDRWRKRLADAGFVLFCAWICFAGWCSVQNAERDKARRDSCTCGALSSP